ncbi:hypothetical protein MTP99_002546 [Tenebrio molitor]|nr:hypothetical protein MTP99_002546 [Tenebrio molitor]
MSKIPKKTRDKKNLDHQRYISRITKTLYYGKFPRPDGLSLPVTELAAELFSEAQRGRSLDRLHCDDAANISRNACMVSCKFLYDDGETDEVFIDEWASSGGTTVKQLVQLEKDFLKAIDWAVFVNGPTFWRKLGEIERSLAKRQGALRGFFTYTELHTLLATIELQTLIQNILAISTILIASYVAAVLTLCGSVFIVSHISDTCLQARKVDVEQKQHSHSLHFGIRPQRTQQCFLGLVDHSDDELVVRDVGVFGRSRCKFEALLLETRPRDLPRVKFLDLEAQVHKSTKIRIQDQLENSWHKEWTDTIKDGFYDRYLYYMQNVKS